MPKLISNEKRADILKHIQTGESKEDVVKWLFITVRAVNCVLNDITNRMLCLGLA